MIAESQGFFEYSHNLTVNFGRNILGGKSKTPSLFSPKSLYSFRFALEMWWFDNRFEWQVNTTRNRSSTVRLALSSIQRLISVSVTSKGRYLENCDESDYKF